VRDAEWIVALDAEERRQGARGGVVVRLASAIEPEWLLDLFPDQVVEEVDVSWDAAAERVLVRDAMLWDGLVLHAAARPEATGPEVARVLAEAALAAGPRAFANENALDRWLSRARFAATVDPSLRAPDDAAVRAALVALCDGFRSFGELRAAGLLDTLKASIGRGAGEIERLVNWMPVKAGETYFTPAHTVHAIGAGIVLCEIQQNSDITYRLWDYGRPRPLHVDQAAPICDLTAHPGAAQPVPIGKGREMLVRSKHFVTEMVRLASGEEFTPSAETCQLWICIEGAGAIGSEPVRAGEVWLLPDSGGQPAIRGGGAEFLRTYVPG